MTRLIFIRHGQSIANVESRFAGHSNFDLSEVGYRQAELAAAYLKEHEKITAVYSSDLLRAWHTALPTARLFGLTPIPDTGLREIYAGKWEGLTFAELQERFPEEYRTWRQECSRLRCPGGESMSEVYDRARETVQRIAAANPGGTLAIATHAMFLRALHAYAEGYGREEAGVFVSPPNASLNIYTFDNGKLVPEKLDIVSHLGDLITSCRKE